MIDLVKKAILTGVGIASLTKEKAEELARELTEKGKMSEQEGSKLVQELLDRADESRETLKSQTENLVKNTLAKMHLARAEDLEVLKNEIEQLRAEVAALSNKSTADEQ